MKYTPDESKVGSAALPFVQGRALEPARRAQTTAVLAATFVFLISSGAAAAGRSSARGVAMGDAVTALAKGIDAARYNPANLGLSGYTLTGLELVGLGANVSNNSFTLGQYNNYAGAFLTDGDKNNILNEVPDEGLSVVADVEASALSLSKGSWVFSISGVGLADANLSKDVIDLMLNGNSFADSIDLTGSHLEGVAYISAGLSYGAPVYRAGTRQVAVGATVKYLRGLAVERMVELEGMAATFETGFAGDGRLIAQTATGGSGYAIDIGVAAHINDDYTVGLRIKNFLSTLSWNGETEEHGYTFSFDTMTLDNMNEDYIVSDDYSKSIPGFSTNLPSVMNVGVANTSGSVLWAVDWEQGFRRAAGASAKPRLSLGFEWWPITSVPLRTGLSSGGNRNTALSFGSGLNLATFYLDFAFATGASLSPYSSKRLNFALSTGLRF